jgi:hypothetical protein
MFQPAGSGSVSGQAFSLSLTGPAPRTWNRIRYRRFASTWKALRASTFSSWWPQRVSRMWLPGPMCAA